MQNEKHGRLVMLDGHHGRGSLIPDQGVLTRQMYGGQADLEQRSYTGLPVGRPVPGADDMVFSPYTTSPKLINVRRFASGTQATCPYTRKAFVVPNLERVAVAWKPQRGSRHAGYGLQPPPPMVAGPPKPRPSVAPKQTARPPFSRPRHEVPVVTQGASREVRTGSLPARTRPRPEAPSAPDRTQGANPIPSDAPFAEWVAGRPGFVRSPHAKDFQLVDVTDIPAGTEVKCPYTGKVFRVPTGPPPTGIPDI
ncbi:hypothetical protein BH23VER1_BH23VER1_37360 [soil metagenome]